MTLAWHPIVAVDPGGRTTGIVVRHRDRLACKPHWYELPTRLRNRIWTTYRDGEHTAHAQAVRDALTHWARAVDEAERSLRCANCRSETIFLEEDGTPICVTCAKASVPGQAPVMVCALCHQPSEVLVGLDADPELCPNCTRVRAHA